MSGVKFTSNAVRQRRRTERHIPRHRMPLLWRYHPVHHADPDLTASTALRFYATEMMLSARGRAAQVTVIGARPQFLRLWQNVTLSEIMSYHFAHQPTSWQTCHEHRTGEGN
jgi:sterol desaturase/sphingolipid hydroxylase (fatty acid hydroxylase superfamily)